ncbi:ankyrin repeats (3 copies) domain-containing protein [Ditylenchus destructor]|nr:ankyrin repeats (3 copies) domain-containing protein [Ditylenchus destructor]
MIRQRCIQSATTTFGACDRLCAPSMILQCLCSLSYLCPMILHMRSSSNMIVCTMIKFLECWIFLNFLIEFSCLSVGSYGVLSSDKEALLQAAKENQWDKVLELAENGTDLNTYSLGGEYPLFLAIKDSTADVVEELIKHGAKVDVRNYFDTFPLYWAVKRGDKDIVKVLLDNGAKLRETFNFSSMLEVAVENNSAEVVGLLIERGLDVNEKDFNQSSPLHGAAFHGYKEMAEILVGKGADVNASNRYNRTPLHEAVENNRAAVVKILVDNGANAQITDQKGYTPFHYAQLLHLNDVEEILRAADTNDDKSLTQPIENAESINSGSKQDEETEKEAQNEEAEVKNEETEKEVQNEETEVKNEETEKEVQNEEVTNEKIQSEEVQEEAKEK